MASLPFLEYLYGTKDTTGDVEVSPGILVHSLVLKWRRIEFPFHGETDEITDRAIVEWAYLSVLPNDSYVLCVMYATRMMGEFEGEVLNKLDEVLQEWDRTARTMGGWEKIGQTMGGWEKNVENFVGRPHGVLNAVDREWDQRGAGMGGGLKESFENFEEKIEKDNENEGLFQGSEGKNVILKVGDEIKVGGEVFREWDQPGPRMGGLQEENIENFDKRIEDGNHFFLTENDETETNFKVDEDAIRLQSINDLEYDSSFDLDGGALRGMNGFAEHVFESKNIHENAIIISKGNDANGTPIEADENAIRFDPSNVADGLSTGIFGGGINGVLFKTNGATPNFSPRLTKNDVIARILKFADDRSLTELANVAMKHLAWGDPLASSSTSPSAMTLVDRNVLKESLRACPPSRAAEMLTRRYGEHRALGIAAGLGRDDLIAAFSHQSLFDSFSTTTATFQKALKEACEYVEAEQDLERVVIALEQCAEILKLQCCALEWACHECDLATMKRLLQRTNKSHLSSSSPCLLLACVTNKSIADSQRAECIKLLALSFGAVCLNGPLHVAAASDSPKCVCALIDFANGNPMERMRGTHRTPIMEASFHDACDALDMLMRKIPPGQVMVDALLLRDAATGSTALHFAAQAGNAACVDIMLDSIDYGGTEFSHGDDPPVVIMERVINCVDYVGRTPLHRACGFVVDALYNEKQQAVASNNNANLPETIIRCLLDRGANPTLQTFDSKTIPLHWICGGGGSWSIGKLPVRLSTDAFDANDVHAKCIQLLLGKSATVLDSPAVDGSTPMHVAVRCGFPSLVRALVVAGCNINAVDSRGSTPLSLATKAWVLELVARAMLLPLMSPPPRRPDGEKCERCLKKFTFLSRPHHCRHCGSCVCSRCSARKARLKKFNGEDSAIKTHRVCDYCFDCLVVAVSMQAPRPQVIRVSSRIVSVDG